MWSQTSITWPQNKHPLAFIMQVNFSSCQFLTLYLSILSLTSADLIGSSMPCCWEPRPDPPQPTPSTKISCLILCQGQFKVHWLRWKANCFPNVPIFFKIWCPMLSSSNLVSSVLLLNREKGEWTSQDLSGERGLQGVWVLTGQKKASHHHHHHLEREHDVEVTSLWEWMGNGISACDEGEGNETWNEILSATLSETLSGQLTVTWGETTCNTVVNFTPTKVTWGQTTKN